MTANKIKLMLTHFVRDSTTSGLVSKLSSQTGETCQGTKAKSEQGKAWHVTGVSSMLTFMVSSQHGRGTVATVETN